MGKQKTIPKEAGYFFARSILQIPYESIFFDKSLRESYLR
jgi:hypothetical protein